MSSPNTKHNEDTNPPFPCYGNCTGSRFNSICDCEIIHDLYHTPCTYCNVCHQCECSICTEGIEEEDDEEDTHEGSHPICDICMECLMCGKCDCEFKRRKLE